MKKSILEFPFSENSYPTCSQSEPGEIVPTVEFKFKLMSPAQGEAVSVRGHVLYPRHILTVTRGEIFLAAGARDLSSAIMQEIQMQIVG